MAADPGYGVVTGMTDDTDDDGDDKAPQADVARLQATWDKYVTKETITRLVKAGLINSAEVLAMIKQFTTEIARGPAGLAKAAKIWAQFSALLRELAKMKAKA
jgi:hypothetical protein